MTATPESRFSARAVVVACLFLVMLPYNGPGHSLQWLAAWGALAVVWLSTSLWREEFEVSRLATGWLPAMALIYLGWLVIAPFVSTYPYASSTAAWGLAVLPITMLGWLTIPEADRQQIWRATSRLLLSCGIALAMWGLVDLLLLKTRAHGPLIDANAYAALMNLFLIPAAFTYLAGAGHREGAISIWQLVVIALLAGGQYASLSRGALISLVAGVLLLGWLQRKKPDFRRRSIYLALILISVHLFVQLLAADPRRGIETFVIDSEQSIESDSSIQTRLSIWRSTWRVIAEANPLIGTGLGTFKTYYAAHREHSETVSTGDLAHNDYLQALQEGGLVQLAFLLAIAIVTPVLLLVKQRHFARGAHVRYDDASGFLVALICISLHAFVNFIQYVGPISFLSGLYLAHAWKTIEPQEMSAQLASLQVSPRTQTSLRILATLLLVVPTVGLVADGVIFKLFSSKEPLLTSVDRQQRLVTQNMALALRPSNPMPRASLISDLLDAAERTPSEAVREKLLAQAEREADTLSLTAPGLASGLFFQGKVRAVRGNREDLLLARSYLARAVKLLPAATAIRLELIRVYQRLGQSDEAYREIVEARRWITLEVDLRALAKLAKEAQALASNRNDHDERAYWSWIHRQVTTAINAK